MCNNDNNQNHFHLIKSIPASFIKIENGLWVREHRENTSAGNKAIKQVENLRWQSKDGGWGWWWWWHLLQLKWNQRKKGKKVSSQARNIQTQSQPKFGKRKKK